MAERYCILPEGGTGVWTDTAIWSTTENGPGGASAPTAAADTAIFTRSATVTGRAASVRSPVTIINAAVIEIASGEACTFQGAGLRIDGTLIVDTTFDCTVNGMTTSSRSVVRKTAGRLFLAIRNTWVTDIHPGTIIESPEIVVCMNDGDTVVPAARYHGATFLGVDPRPAGEHNGRFCFADADYYFSHLRPLNINPANANYSVPKTAWRMRAARVVAGSLRFDIRNFDAVLEVSQENASITVTGDVAHSIARADALDVGPGLEIVLTGTQDQAVALPSETDGLVALRLDKPAGLVTLQQGDVDLQVKQYGASLATLPGTKVRT